MVDAKIVTPTAMNLASMEEAVARALRGLAVAEPAQASREAAKVVRAFDPCFSCSVHCVGAG